MKQEHFDTQFKRSSVVNVVFNINNHITTNNSLVIRIVNAFYE